MNDQAHIALFFWVDDNPVTGNVLSLKSIVKPRKDFDEYKIGEKVLANCPQWGQQNAIIGKLAVETCRKDLQSILKGPAFFTLLKEVLDKNEAEAATGAHDAMRKDTGSETVKVRQEGKAKAATGTKRKPGDRMESDAEVTVRQEGKAKVATGTKRKAGDRMESDAEVRPEGNAKPATGTKRKAQDIMESDAEVAAKRMKKEESKEKRLREKEREAVNARVTKELFSSREQKQEKSEVTELKDLVTALGAKIDTIIDMTNCPKCMKGMYKRSMALATLEPSSPALLQKTLHSFMQLPASPAPTAPVPAAAALGPVPEKEEEASVAVVDLSHNDGDQDESASFDDDLVYFGESRFGVKITREAFMRVQQCSKTGIKFALNSVELLLSPEECKSNMTVYGEGKGKTAMPPNKRKALRSQMFSLFEKEMSESSKESHWNDVVVPKLNNKIRGIRNNRYNLSGVINMASP